MNENSDVACIAAFNPLETVVPANLGDANLRILSMDAAQYSLSGQAA